MNAVERSQNQKNGVQEMLMTKRMFGTAMLLACSSAPLTLVAGDDPPAGAQEAQVIVVTQVAGDDQAGQEKSYTPLRVVSGAQQSADVPQPNAWLGVGLKEVAGDLAAYLGSSEGTLVEDVYPDSPAQDAKLEVGDIIVAFEGQKIASPQALIEALRKFEQEHAKKSDKSDKSEKASEQKKDEKDGEKAIVYPSVELKLLRHGKEKTVTLTPVERPESFKVPMAESKDRAAGELADMDKLLQDLQSQGTAKVLRFGPPLTLPGPPMLRGPQRREVRNFVVVVKDKDGETTEVNIEVEAGKPPKITLKEGNKSREITAADIPHLKEHVRKVVTDALERFEKDQRQHRSDDAQRDAKRQQLMAQIHENMQRNAELQEQLRRLSGGGGEFPILPAEGNVRQHTPAEELTTRIRGLAEELANRGAKNVQEFAALPQELHELRKQVDEIKQQLSELQKRLQPEKD
jgi:hypothetical protein